MCTENRFTRDELEGWSTSELAIQAFEFELYYSSDSALNSDRSDLINEILNHQN